MTTTGLCHKFVVVELVSVIVCKCHECKFNVVPGWVVINLISAMTDFFWLSVLCVHSMGCKKKPHTIYADGSMQYIVQYARSTQTTQDVSTHITE